MLETLAGYLCLLLQKACCNGRSLSHELRESCEQIYLREKIPLLIEREIRNEMHSNR